MILESQPEKKKKRKENQPGRAETQDLGLNPSTISLGWSENQMKKHITAKIVSNPPKNYYFLPSEISEFRAIIL